MKRLKIILWRRLSDDNDEESNFIIMSFVLLCLTWQFDDNGGSCGMLHDNADHYGSCCVLNDNDDYCISCGMYHDNADNIVIMVKIWGWMMWLILSLNACM